MSIWMWILIYCVVCYGVVGSLNWMWGFTEGDSMDAAMGKFVLYGAPLLIPGLIIAWMVAISCLAVSSVKEKIWGE